MHVMMQNIWFRTRTNVREYAGATILDIPVPQVARDNHDYHDKLVGEIECILFSIINSNLLGKAFNMIPILLYFFCFTLLLQLLRLFS